MESGLKIIISRFNIIDTRETVMNEKNLSVRAGDVWENALDYLKIDGRHKVKDQKSSIDSSDTKREVQPEEFTKTRILDNVFFDLLELERQPGEKRFTWSTKNRSVDYCLENDNGDAFVVEAKPLNGDLNSERTSSAVNQVEDVFELREGYENYEFGIATDGKRWIIINNEGEVVEDLEFPASILRLRDYIEGKKKPVSEKRQEEITDKFYQWYDSLLHGGTYKDNEGNTKHIDEEDSLVENIYYADDEHKPEIAQTIANRLIFIKFLQSKQIIGENILDDLKQLDESRLNDKMKELFFQVMNTPEGSRVNISKEFQDIPYLNGSLFKRNEAEDENPDYQVKYEILRKFLDFLDQFAFVNKESLEEKEAIDPKILGYIFERAMTSDERENTGAYYTPRAVTHYIAQNTVKPTLLEKSKDYLREEKGVGEENLPESVDELIRKHKHSLWDIRQEILIEDFKVADPACGSGAFLLAVANIMWDIHQRIDERIGNDYGDVWLKKLILRNNIYGVDINHKATEIARLRLWLWLVDSYDSNNVDALPNIDYNIISGNTLAGFVDITRMKEKGELPGQNSLSKWSGEALPKLFKQKNEQISRYKELSGREAEKARESIEKLDKKIGAKLDTLYFTYAKDRGVELSEDELNSVDIFHWGAEFTNVYNPEKNPGNRGFDVLVGNPPYIKYKKIDSSTKELLGELYETPYFEYDIAVPFTERSQDLINQKGKLGFIMTKQWLKSRYGEKLKDKLIEERSVEELIDFTDQQVFKGVTTYTIIVILNKQENEEIRYGEIRALNDDIREKLSQLKNFNESDSVKAFISGYETLTKENWSFLPIEQSRIISHGAEETFSSLTKSVSQGVVTGDKDVFVLDLVEEGKSHYTVYSDALDQNIKLEKEICRPLVNGDYIQRWSAVEPEMIILYPYRIQDGESHLIDIREIEKKYPKAYQYLETNKSLLKPKQEQWHEFNRVRSANIEVFEGTKAIVAKLSNQSKSYLDLDDHVFVGGIGAKLKESKDISYPYFVAAMNSRLLEWMVQKTSRGVRGNTYSYAEKYIKDLPIPVGNHKETIETLSEDMRRFLPNGRDREEVTIIENLIDYLFYETYFSEFNDDLLRAVKNIEKEELEVENKAERIKKSSEISKAISEIYSDDRVKMVDTGKSRENCWNI
ncbi:N-6 DNA methylase [Nanohaloarchaea archaeon H01]|nr:N-6 DNA methylase [Nanohaloarchaea archaeon H01]